MEALSKFFASIRHKFRKVYEVTLINVNVCHKNKEIFSVPELARSKNQHQIYILNCGLFFTACFYILPAQLRGQQTTHSLHNFIRPIFYPLPHFIMLIADNVLNFKLCFYMLSNNFILFKIISAILEWKMTQESETKRKKI